MYPIGTIVTYNKTRWRIIGYKPHLTTKWYKIQPLAGGRYNTCSGKYFTEIDAPLDSCEHVTCNTFCKGRDRYNRVCVNGVCVDTDTVLYKDDPDCIKAIPPPPPSPVVDVCPDGGCPRVCVGTSIYEQDCVDGVCVRGAFLASNVGECGYAPWKTPTPPAQAPTPTPEPTPTPDPMPPRPTPPLGKGMFPIGTTVTYLNARWKVTGYKPHLTTAWYIVQPVGGGGFHTTPGTSFNDIVYPRAKPTPSPTPPPTPSTPAPKPSPTPAVPSPTPTPTNVLEEESKYLIITAIAIVAAYVLFR